MKLRFPIMRIVLMIVVLAFGISLALAQTEPAQTPDSETPGGENPAEETPGSVTPGTDTPAEATPEGDATPAADAAPAAATPVEPVNGEELPMGMYQTGTIEGKLIQISMASARALLYVLFFMSILSVAVAIEKYVQFKRDDPLGVEFRPELAQLLAANDIKGALDRVEGVRGVNAALIREGLQNFSEGPEAIEEVMEGREILERGRLERHLIILGTIGNNAPFVGLLGTVMGIIRSFHDLAHAATEGPQTVMAGISEALIATAVGLFVAIPAVILYNWLKGKARALLDEAAANAKIILAYAKSSREG